MLYICQTLKTFIGVFIRFLTGSAGWNILIFDWLFECSIDWLIDCFLDTPDADDAHLPICDLYTQVNHVKNLIFYKF